MKKSRNPNQPGALGKGAKSQLEGQGIEPRKTNDLTSEPIAKAREAQVPAPLPQKQRDDDGEGITILGQGYEGNDSHNPLSNFATKLTQAIERRA